MRKRRTFSEIRENVAVICIEYVMHKTTGNVVGLSCDAFQTYSLYIPPSH